VFHSAAASSGRRLMLLHGNPGRLEHFEALIPKLEQTVEILAVDLPGFGKSAPAPAKLFATSLPGLARVAFAVADAFGWETFEVLGHSHGAGVAQAMAWRANPRVLRLILLGTLGFPAHTAYRQLALPGVAQALGLLGKCLSLPGGKAWLRGVQRGFVRKAFHPQPLPEAQLERDVDAMLAAPTILRSMARVAHGKPCDALSAEVAGISCPTTFVHGESDRLVPPRHARNLHERRLAAGRQSVFSLVPGAGHMLPLTHPELVAEYVFQDAHGPA
jgi:pimeloyl-ACP methyl ester carboxylesterase